MAMYQDAKGNWRSGEGSGTQYNYTNTAGQAVNNSGNNGPVYTPASNMSAANANERSAMDSFRANPGSALSQLQNLGGTYTERMKSGDVAGAKTVQDYANSISKVAGVTPQSFSFTGVTGQGYTPPAGAVYTPNVGIPAATPPKNNNNGFQFAGYTPPAYDPKFNYSTNTPIPQTTQGVVDPAKAGDGSVAGATKTDTVVKDDRGTVIGIQLASGGFMPTNTGSGNTMGIGSFEQSQFGYPGMPQTSNGTASNAFPVKTPDQIKAEAKARTDALLAKQTTIAGQTKQGFQTSFDRLASTTKDDRTLQDAAFQRNTNPFSGGTGYQQDMTGRQREISDQQSREDLQTRLANVDLSLADYANATDAQRMQMETDMTNAERAYGMQVDQLALQRQGQALGQFNADRSFNYGVSRDNVGDSRYADTTNYNRSRDSLTDSRYTDTTAYNRGQDQITNNRNAANDALTLRKQHIDEANYYSDKYGFPVQPKDDFQLVLDQVAGKQTVAQQTAAQKAEETKRSEAWKRVEFGGSVQTQADADLLGIPVGTLSQKAKEFAMDSAYKNRTASSSEANQQFTQKLASSKFELEKLKNGQERDTAIGKLLDSSPFINKTYDDNNKVTGITVTNKQSLADSIISLNLPTDEMQKWFNYYGIDYRNLGK